MYKFLTKEQSLFMINDTILEEFKHLVETIPMTEKVKPRLVYDTINMWASTFNIWCVMVEEEKELSLDFQKMMIYSSNFYAIDLIRQNVDIKSFLQAHTNTEQVKYLLAYYVGSEITLLIRKALAQFEEGRSINERNKERLYFKAHEVKIEEDDTFFIDQKRIVSVLTKSNVETKELQERIQHAIQLTRRHLAQIN